MESRTAEEPRTAFSSEFNSELEDLVSRLDSVHESKDAKSSIGVSENHHILSYQSKDDYEKL